MSYVYLITDGNLCKIGVAKDPQQRLKALQTGNSNTLILIAAGYKYDKGMAHFVEKQIHRGLRQWHVHGEWFNLNQRLMDVVTTQIQGNPSKLNLEATMSTPNGSAPLQSLPL